ncbi:hypothetical protein LXA43DRAFT_1082392 [Ganoderma leucocontextum]|nr:hypothetical protein LXA43DRAFT_1082392 [Ganoderma leucocontextum]
MLYRYESGDRAVVSTFQGYKFRQLFSRAVPANAFIKELFPPGPDIAQKVRESLPDNLPASNPSETQTRTFEEAFGKDAVLNFTHFAEGADGSDSALDEDAALPGCFLRSMAVVCRSKGAIILMVDVFLPVLMKRSERLRPEVMSARILVQFRVRKVGSTRAAYEVDERAVGLFRPRPRPLAASVYLFGHHGAGSHQAGRAAARGYSRRFRSGLYDREGSYTKPAIRSPSTTGRQIGHTRTRRTIFKFPARLPPLARPAARVQKVHSRYSMYAYGCSPSVHRVIGEPYLYKKLIRAGDVLAKRTHGAQAVLLPRECEVALRARE